MKNKEKILRACTLYIAYLLVVWGFYRMLFQFPVEVEELVIKPIFWLIPVFFIIKKQHISLKDIGITTKNLFPAVYSALALGALFAIEGFFVNTVKYQGLNFSANIGDGFFFSALGISFATAISEEIAFRGYIFGRLSYLFKNEFAANVITTAFWSAVHLPVAIFWWKLSFANTLIHLFLIALFGFGASFLYARTKNIISPILLHVLWTWPVILFR